MCFETSKYFVRLHSVARGALGEVRGTYVYQILVHGSRLRVRTDFPLHAEGVLRVQKNPAVGS